MKKTVAILGAPENWTPLIREYRQLANFLCVSPVMMVSRDDADFSLFLVNAFAGKYDTIVITCPAAVDAMIDMSKRRNMQDRLKEAANRTEVVAIGQKTYDQIEGYGIQVSSMAAEATTDALLDHLNSRSRRGAVAILRSDQGSPDLVRALQDTGWAVEDVPVYTLVMDESETMDVLLDSIEDGKVDVLVFSTPVHAQGFMVQLEERCGDDDAVSLLIGLQIAAMGRETKECLESYGIKVTMTPSVATQERLLAELLQDI